MLSALTLFPTGRATGRVPPHLTGPAGVWESLNKAAIVLPFLSLSQVHSGNPQCLEAPSWLLREQLTSDLGQERTKDAGGRQGQPAQDTLAGRSCTRASPHPFLPQGPTPGFHTHSTVVFF